MHRFYADPMLSDERRFFLNADDTVHAVKVLRMQQGDRAEIISGGQRFLAAVESTAGDRTEFLPVSLLPSTEPAVSFTLFQGLPKGDKMDWIAQKATELGAAGVYPVYTDNCALNKSVIDKKITKWQRTMYEASKQCERANIPVCYELNTIDTLLKTRNFDFVFAFCERNADMTFREFYNLNKSMFSKGNDILVIIGPEGGFSKTEFEYFAQHSIPMLTLGDLILKAETAVIVAIGNIIYEYNYSK